eukprot:4475279-Alexandrium_andersonii.AAC.1
MQPPPSFAAYTANLKPRLGTLELALASSSVQGKGSEKLRTTRREGLAFETEGHFATNCKVPQHMELPGDHPLVVHEGGHQEVEDLIRIILGVVLAETLGLEVPDEGLAKTTIQDEREEGVRPAGALGPLDPTKASIVEVELERALIVGKSHSLS